VEKIMGRYAERTKVPVAKTVGDIERVVNRYDADQFVFGRDDKKGIAFIGFQMNNVRIRVSIPFSKDNEQEHRQRWRAALLIIKAKLEAVESGISTLEQEFLANILLPDGRTMIDWIVPQLENIKSDKMPALIPEL
jgi:hypothetical protein